MNNFGENIRSIRKENSMSLEEVSNGLGIDVAVLSKVERGLRSASRQQVVALAEYFDLNFDQLMKLWLSDKLYQQVEDESVGLEALKLAEETLIYATATSPSLEGIKKKLLPVFRSDKRIFRAWIFGSFSRSENTENSDVDLLLEIDENSDFNFFDLAEIQYHAEQLLGQKVDLGVQGTENDHVKESILKDRVLIYEFEE